MVWYSRDTETVVLSEDFENEIVLSDEFYREINAHRIPTDLEAVKLLVSSPAVLDLFMWLSYRSFTAKGEERVPLFGPDGLTAQLGSVEYARPRKFRDQSHRTAKAIAWIKANYTKPLRVEDLAEVAGMAVSTLHHHFRALTAMYVCSEDPVHWHFEVDFYLAQL